MDMDGEITQEEFDKLSNLDATILKNRYERWFERENMNAVEFVVTHADHFIYESAAFFRDAAKHVGAIALKGVSRITPSKK